MSLASINQFRSQVASSSTLQAALASALANGPNAVAALGKLHGYEFSAAEVATAAAGSDLTDFELGLVSGGYAAPFKDKDEPWRMG